MRQKNAIRTKKKGLFISYMINVRLEKLEWKILAYIALAEQQQNDFE